MYDITFAQAYLYQYSWTTLAHIALKLVTVNLTIQQLDMHLAKHLVACHTDSKFTDRHSIEGTSKAFGHLFRLKVELLHNKVVCSRARFPSLWLSDVHHSVNMIL